MSLLTSKRKMLPLLSQLIEETAEQLGTTQDPQSFSELSLMFSNLLASRRLIQTPLRYIPPKLPFNGARIAADSNGSVGRIESEHPRTEEHCTW